MLSPTHPALLIVYQLSTFFLHRISYEMIKKIYILFIRSQQNPCKRHSHTIYRGSDDFPYSSDFVKSLLIIFTEPGSIYFAICFAKFLTECRIYAGLRGTLSFVYQFFSW